MVASGWWKGSYNSGSIPSPRVIRTQISPYFVDSVEALQLMARRRIVVSSVIAQAL